MTSVQIFGVISFAIGYLGGRWHGVVHERDTLRDVIEELRKRGEAE